MKSITSFLSEHPIRKTKKQKTAFIQHLCATSANSGYVSEIEQPKTGSRNVVVGDLSEADVIFTAHYDTPARSIIPTFITPNTPWFTTLSKALVALAVVASSLLVFFIFRLVLSFDFIPGSISMIVSILAAVAAFVVAMKLTVMGSPKENNANANTSGLKALLETMEDLPAELRNKAAFVFLDNQENGYVGAAEFDKRHKKIVHKKLIVNFDCVGVGKNIVVAVNGGAKHDIDAITAAFASSDGYEVKVMKGGKHIPSDHIKFKRAAGVSAFKKTEKGQLYMDNICTAGDSECSENNITFIKRAAIKLISSMSGISVKFDETPLIPEESEIKEEIASPAEEQVIEEAAEQEEVVSEPEEDAAEEVKEESEE